MNDLDHLNPGTKLCGTSKLCETLWQLGFIKKNMFIYGFLPYGLDSKQNIYLRITSHQCV